MAIKILIQLNQNLLKNRVDAGYNKKLCAYVFIVDKDGNLSRNDFYKEFMRNDFNKYISQGGEFKSDKIIFYTKGYEFLQNQLLRRAKAFHHHRL